MERADTIILGAGASGLARAHALVTQGEELLVMEAAPRAGGCVQSVYDSGYLCELGPNTLQVATAEVEALLQATGVLARAVPAAPQAKNRFVVKGGRLHPLPMSPVSFLLSPLLSPWGKWELLSEPLTKAGGEPDESLAAFVTRRLGQEALREFVDPFVSGIYAGDPHQLLVQHAMPTLARMEREHGSLFKAMVAGMRKGGFKRKLLSWPGGLSEMIDSLARPLGERLKLSSNVLRLEKNPQGYLVHTETQSYSARKLILATPAPQAARLLATLGREVPELETCPHAPVTVLHLGFKREAVAHPLNGFGVLISRSRAIRTLGALFSSTLFPGRAPEGHVMLTVFLGGTRDPAAAALPEREAHAAALHDLSPLLGITGPPVFQRLTRWPKAIPQYDATHTALLNACNRVEAEFQGLSLIGNYRTGISLSQCLEQA